MKEWVGMGEVGDDTVAASQFGDHNVAGRTGWWFGK